MGFIAGYEENRERRVAFTGRLAWTLVQRSLLAGLHITTERSYISHRYRQDSVAIFRTDIGFLAQNKRMILAEVLLKNVCRLGLDRNLWQWT